MRREHELLHDIEGVEEALIMMAGHHRLSTILSTIARLIDDGEIRVSPRPDVDDEIENVSAAVAGAAKTCRQIEERRRRKR